ncbi:Hydrolase [Lachnellula hyalina]|uniref:Hydrolase n=1 Tax=Lachnellula hyalina TaxID=1316788 RepID=A0A8H8RAC7_9HELO|nr:Hydrolase [Lachnellula hyalina]TVY30904.1 Hydrolase [Lachnellula hyalina]
MASPLPIPRVALIQIPIQTETTPTLQLRKATELIIRAARENADLAVLPEMFLGWTPTTPKAKDEYATQCAEAISHFQALAEEHSINIIPGSICEAEKSGHGKTSYYNTTYYISRAGAILLSYRKVNLWVDERLAFSKGDVHRVIDTPEFGKLGLLICWDLAFPEAFRMLIKQGARMIVIPTQWRSSDCGPAGLKHNPLSETTFIDSVICARAFENNACVVFCNVGGPETEGNFGGSQVTLPFKGAIAKLGPEEEMRVVEIEFGGILGDAEEVWGIRGDVASEGWYDAKRS